MDELVHSVIASCVACQSSDKTARIHPAPMQPVELSQGPFQKVAVDIMGLFEKERNDCRFAIVLVDYFSRWPEVAFAAHVTATTVTSFLASVFSCEGNPITIVTMLMVPNLYHLSLEIS